MRRQYRQDYPELSADDWYAVADAYRTAESDRNVWLFSVVARRLKSAVGLGETAPTQVDDRTELLRDFVVRTRRNRRPADDLTAALMSNGFSSQQVAALALLVDPLTSAVGDERANSRSPTSTMDTERTRHPA